MRDSHAQPNALTRSVVVWLGLLIFVAPFSIAPARDNAVDTPVAPFRLTETGGEIGLSFDYFGETQTHEGYDSIRFSNLTFEEYILMRLRGYVYHPRFLDFRTRVKIGLLQQFITRSGLDEDESENLDSNTFVSGYDIYLAFLKEHPLSVSIFANRDRRPVLQLFTDRQLIETENVGAIINWKKGAFPMDVSFTSSRFREWGADSRSDATNKIFQ
jgi:hypothetical protein